MKVTYQPELLQQGNEALQDTVDPVHCSEMKRKVIELCVSSTVPGSDILQPTLDHGLTHTNKALSVEF